MSLASNATLAGRGPDAPANRVAAGIAGHSDQPCSTWLILLLYDHHHLAASLLAASLLPPATPRPRLDLAVCPSPPTRDVGRLWLLIPRGYTATPPLRGRVPLAASPVSTACPPNHHVLATSIYPPLIDTPFDDGQQRRWPPRTTTSRRHGHTGGWDDELHGGRRAADRTTSSAADNGQVTGSWRSTSSKAHGGRPAARPRRTASKGSCMQEAPNACEGRTGGREMRVGTGAGWVARTTTRGEDDNPRRGRPTARTFHSEADYHEDIPQRGPTTTRTTRGQDDNPRRGRPTSRTTYGEDDPPRGRRPTADPRRGRPG
ncbi:hypothetical protein BJ912DRAFT_1069895 [Pholiota molesta]|nr:hypothetical protein BJ912DRAFT_1069895 [Pholiota molesta]